MKIEKLNDKQIKIFLTQDDLEERDIKLSEFAYGSEKAQSLFKDMMEKANKECGFYSDTNRFIIEAIPDSLESIILIITKISEDEDILDKLGVYRNNKSSNKTNTVQISENTDVLIYCFKSLDIISTASSLLVPDCNNKSSLFKYKSVYYLIVDISDSNNDTYISSVLSEYGIKQNVSILSEYFFIEHGEPIIKDNAINILSSI